MDIFAICLLHLTLRYNMDWIVNTEIVLDPNKSVIKRLWCTFYIACLVGFVQSDCFLCFQLQYSQINHKIILMPKLRS